MLLLISINLVTFELPRPNPLGEQNVQLLVRSALSLGVAEESPQEEEEAGATPDKGGISAQVPLQRIHAVGFNDSDHYTSNVVGVPRETNGLLAQAR